MSPDPFSLLDVLAAAGAARASGQRFSFRVRTVGRDIFPAVSPEQAANVIADLRAADFTPLDMGHMDLLRGLGQQPSFSDRARYIAETVEPEHITGWLDDYAMLKVSLRLEGNHPSDVPAAYRWQGSSPLPRKSHPGRNALGLTVLLNLPLPGIFQVPPPASGTYYPAHKWHFSRPRVWYAPTVPVSYESWRAIQTTGPGRDDKWALGTDIIEREIEIPVEVENPETGACEIVIETGTEISVLTAPLSGLGRWITAAMTHNAKMIALATPRLLVDELAQ